MSVELTNWKKALEDFGKETKGVYKIKKFQSLPDGGEMFRITIDYTDSNIVLTQHEHGGRFIGPSFLILETPYEKENLRISVIRRDFFDKLFSPKGHTYVNKEFDKEFKVKSSDERLALKIFKETRVQKLFLENPMLLFNVVTERGKTIIRMKNMVPKNYSKEELLYYLEEFKFILSKIFE